MPKLKAVFITSFVVFVLGASAYAIWRLARDPSLSWVGSLLTTLPPALFVVRVYTLGRVARSGC